MFQCDRVSAQECTDISFARIESQAIVYQPSEGNVSLSAQFWCLNSCCLQKAGTHCTLVCSMTEIYKHVVWLLLFHLIPSKLLLDPLMVSVVDSEVVYNFAGDFGECHTLAKDNLLHLLQVF